MLIEELLAAIREKEAALQRVSGEAQRLLKEIETLKSAVQILEREDRSHFAVERPEQPVRIAQPDTIRKAFP